MSELAYLKGFWTYYQARLDLAHEQEGIIGIETAIIAAILATAALGLGAIVMSKVTTKAESIPTE